ncbi:hypothetical protein T11_16364 [Trichinella zimbabwensis]|uniref:Uncharacterized protein n=1 Tax=Trichinella zimbabwensis TaxID=268475 RepID=A0A0V1GMH2_9BILA|nr:hypothetical protein T11_16364 [Trichinella zimbabwensis]
MRAKLYGGNPPRDGQNSGGVDFVEAKRHGAEKSLQGCSAKICPGLKKWKESCGEKTAGSGKMQAKLFGESGPGLTKFLWCGFRGEKTGRGDGGAKTALVQANGRGVFGVETACGGKLRAELFEGKPPRVGQNSGGVDFVEGKRHGAEKKAPRKSPQDGQNSGGVDFVERKRHRAEMKPPRLFR